MFKGSIVALITPFKGPREKQGKSIVEMEPGL